MIFSFIVIPKKNSFLVQLCQAQNYDNTNTAILPF
jgi:hypothetical protein